MIIIIIESEKKSFTWTWMGVVYCKERERDAILTYSISDHHQQQILKMMMGFLSTFRCKTIEPKEKSNTHTHTHLTPTQKKSINIEIFFPFIIIIIINLVWNVWIWKDNWLQKRKSWIINKFLVHFIRISLIN